MKKSQRTHTFIPILGFIGLLTVQAGNSSENCPSVCGNFETEKYQLEKSIKRLEEIKSVNMEYISTLGTNQSSQALKANSNIKLADKRILELKQKKQGLESGGLARQCETCEKE